MTVLSIFPGPQEPIPNYRFIQVELNAADDAGLTEVKRGIVKSAESNSQGVINWNTRKALHCMNVSLLRHPIVAHI